MTIQEMINALVEEANDIRAAADADEDANGLLTDEQITRVEAINAEIERLNAQVAAREQIDAIGQAGAAVEPPRSVEPQTANVDDLVPTGITTREPNPDQMWGWAAPGDFYGAVIDASNPGLAVDERLHLSAAPTGLNQAVGSEGGFLVPTQMATEIWDGMAQEVENLLPMTTQWTVTGEAIEIPAVDETSRATGSRAGGIQGFWINEAETITSSNPKFRRVRLEPHELAAIVPVTNKLLRNAPQALGEFITRKVTQELIFLVSDAIVNGTGTGQPLGILNSTARVTVAAEGGQAADTIVIQNINKMWLRMFAPSRRNAVWLINQDIEQQLAELSLSVGTGGLPVYLPANGLADSPFATLKGRPVMPVEYTQTLGDEGDIILADLRAYTTGIHRAIESAMSIHVRFQENESLMRFTWAADGRPWADTALTPFNGTNTLSSFVTLAART